MKAITVGDAAAEIRQAKAITFLTGAGVSTASGVPDYRSLKGVYHGIESPEYLLSNKAMLQEPQKFYQFVQNLYHPSAKPNVIHQVMARLEKTSSCWVVSQNIDGLHEQAGSTHLVNFHGSLYHCHCRQCSQAVDWQEYRKSDQHQSCGGQIRPDIVLYGEGFTDEVLDSAVAAVRQADLLVIVGTSFQVHPFCDLVHYKQSTARILAINQTELYIPLDYMFVQANGVDVFKEVEGETNDKD